MDIATPAQGSERVVSDEDKKLSQKWRDRIESSLRRVDAKFKTFEANRRLLAGVTSGGGSVRANLHYANLAAMLPQVYAKDPEFAGTPTQAVPVDDLEKVKRFARTAEFMLHKVVVKDARLKHHAKKVIRSCFATSVGWLKASWQEDRRTDALIANRIKDTQDNIANIQLLLQQVNDPQVASDHESKLAELKQALAGLETQQEIVVAKGVALDFVMSEDILIIDDTIRAVTDYTRAAAIGHRVWMSLDQYQQTFGYKPLKARHFSEQGGQIKAGGDSKTPLLCVWEIWDQQANRIHYVCEGEEGFCKPSTSPEWTGKRWYPFFLTAFNEIDGSLYPLSDIELTDKLVKEYNESREDFVRDRRECLPINIARKGGSLTDDDLQRIKNRRGGDLVLVEGAGGQPISNDIWSGSLGQLKPENYDTGASRYDMERLLGGSEATTGSITKADTATQSQILAQSMRSRTGERQDTLEDVFNELGPYCLEMMLRKFSEQEVQRMAGPEASWPQMSIDDIFDLVTLEVRAGSTGKPDQAMEQERWLKVLPIIQAAVEKVAQLREQGQEELAQAVIEVARETLRRFDERIEIEEFLPKQAQDPADPNVLKRQLMAATAQNQVLMEQNKDLQAKVERGYVSAAATIATSANPAVGALAFRQVLQEIDQSAPGAASMPGTGPDAGPLSQQPMAIPQ